MFHNKVVAVIGGAHGIGKCIAAGASIVNISSSRDRMSQPQTESYTAAKGGMTRQMIYHNDCGWTLDIGGNDK